jgi:alpha-galactosidase
VSPRGPLNFGKQEALAWAKGEIDRLVTAHQLDYIKMDFNTNLSDGGDRPAGAPDPLWAHYRGLADLWNHMRRKHPRLIVENCASGSLRQDLFAAAHTDNHWVSDAVRGSENLAINFGATYLFPPEICSHFTCFPKPSDALDLQTHFTVSMLGQFGLSGAITTWDASTRKIAADSIALYKQLRTLLRQADVFHLTEQASAKSPRSIQAVHYVDSRNNRAVLFAFQGGAQELKTTLLLRGLQRESVYRLLLPAGFGPEREVRGEVLMRGLTLTFPRRGSSAVLRIEPSASAKNE